MRDLFDNIQNDRPSVEHIGDCAFVLRGFALPFVDQLLPALDRIQTVSPFRHMITPGGFKMSVALTNCGRFGWITDRRGYRYSRVDPETCQPWPCMPSAFMALAQSAAMEAGYPTFEPDACLINNYEPGARLTLHQDKNERSFNHPIVSVSLGIRRHFFLEVSNVPIRSKKFSSCTGTSLCGAVKIVCGTMEFRNSRMRLIRYLAQSASISPSAKPSEVLCGHEF